MFVKAQTLVFIETKIKQSFHNTDSLSTVLMKTKNKMDVHEGGKPELDDLTSAAELIVGNAEKQTKIHVCLSLKR